MAWTAPRTWIDQEVVTEANFNTHIRDNFLALDQHAHGGAAGAGASSLGNLVKGTFTDASAPAAPGSGKTVVYAVSGRPTYRAGSAGASTRLADANDLHAQTHATTHQPSGADAMAVDAVVATGSLRTLGTGARQGAVGSHTHVAASQATGRQDQQASSTITDGTETNGASVSATPGGASRLWIVEGAISFRVDQANNYDIKLYFDAEVLQTRSGIADDLLIFSLSGIKSSPTVASHTVKVTCQRVSGSSNWAFDSCVTFREIDVT